MSQELTGGLSHNAGYLSQHEDCQTTRKKEAKQERGREEKAKSFLLLYYVKEAEVELKKSSSLRRRSLYKNQSENSQG
jgi:hypothetical protein